jgi:hypothetical protein
MFGCMKLSMPEYQEIYQKTGLDVDSRQPFVGAVASMMERNIKRAITFIKSVPGFSQLPLTDQVHLIKGMEHSCDDDDEDADKDEDDDDNDDKEDKDDEEEEDKDDEEEEDKDDDDDEDNDNADDCLHRDDDCLYCDDDCLRRRLSMTTAMTGEEDDDGIDDDDDKDDDKDDDDHDDGDDNDDAKFRELINLHNFCSFFFAVFIVYLCIVTDNCCFLAVFVINLHILTDNRCEFRMLCSYHRYNPEWKVLVLPSGQSACIHQMEMLWKLQCVEDNFRAAAVLQKLQLSHDEKVVLKMVTILTVGTSALWSVKMKTKISCLRAPENHVQS